MADPSMAGKINGRSAAGTSENSAITASVTDLSIQEVETESMSRRMPQHMPSKT
jgi:hypothetical protein